MIFTIKITLILIILLLFPFASISSEGKNLEMIDLEISEETKNKSSEYLNIFWQGTKQALKYTIDFFLNFWNNYFFKWIKFGWQKLFNILPL